MLKTSRLATKLLWREWRKGEWFVIFFSLLLSVAAITALHFYTDRLTRAFDQEGANFIGGNLVITSSTAIPDKWLQKITELKLKNATVWSYPSMITAIMNGQQQMQLVTVQAVSEHFPLLTPQQRPARHTVWIDPRLQTTFKINDTLVIGVENFVVAKILSTDMDALNTSLVIAPRVMMRVEDIPATKTVIAGSRVDYRLLMAGNTTDIQQFQQWVTPQLKSNQKIIDPRNQQLRIHSILERAENYTLLILLVCLLMSGVAIALSVHHYLKHHYAQAALWRCLGAKEKQIVAILIWQLLLVAVLAGGIGVAMGYGVHLLFVNLFKDVLPLTLPAASSTPVFMGFGISLFLLFSFAYPVIYQLPRTSPLYLWREQTPVYGMRGNLFFIAALSSVCLFIFIFTDFSLLTLFFIATLFICVGLLYACSLLLLRGLRLLTPHTQGAIRRGLSQLMHYPDSVSLQFIGFTLILFALLTLALVRIQIINDWQQNLPQQTPNYFVINIAPEDKTRFNQFLQQQHITHKNMYPIVRGRLTALNQKSILTAVPESARNNNALHRELNLSWMWQFPEDNKIVSGRAWNKTDENKAFVSVEKSLADDLGLRLGDTLAFQLADKQFSAEIISVRTLNWLSFRPNFYMLFPPGFLDNLPMTYMTSFYLSPQQTVLLKQLSTAFPNITIIDVAEMLKQITYLMTKISLAMQYLFLFALGIGVLIFIASLQASLAERRETYYLLHMLGAGKKYIYKSIGVEFMVLAIFIVGMSWLLAQSVTFLLIEKIF